MNTLKNNRNSRKRQKGVALIAAMTALLLVTAITAGMIILSTTETNISSNFRDEQSAYFAAKAGLEEIRDRLQKNVAGSLRTPANLLPTALPGNGTNGVLYVLNPANGETVAPWVSPTPNNPNPYFDNEICKENTAIQCSNSTPPGGGWYSTTAASSVYAVNPTLVWKWTRITLKQNNAFAPYYYTNGNSASAAQVCWDVNHNQQETNSCVAPDYLPVYILTTLAVTPSGSRRMIQAEVAEDNIKFQAPAALTLDGLGDTFGGGNSKNFTVSGIDQGGCGLPPGNQNVSAVGVPDPADVATVIAGIPGNRTGNYVGVDGTTPDVQNVGPTGTNTLPANLQTAQQLQQFASALQNDVTQPVINGPAGNPANGGAPGAPQIIYVNGDLNLSGNFTGYGILVVTGKLSAVGTSGWNGLVLVVGEGQAQISGTTQWNGAMLLANTLTGTLGNLSLSGDSMGVNGGGNGGIYYSSGCLAQATTMSTYHILALRELMR